MADAIQITSGFKFYRYNDRRRCRGVEAVQMQIFENGEQVGLLWMSRKDINNNIREFGMCPALHRGLQCYQTHKDPGEPSN